jgi:hypothetical protein
VLCLLDNGEVVTFLTRFIILNDKSKRKYPANVSNNIRMVVDLSPDGAAYSSTQIKSPTFEDVAQLSPDWASVSF